MLHQHCVSHMTKATVDKLRQCEADVARKKFALVLFAASHRCHDPRTVMQLHAQAYVVFHSAHKSQQVVDSSAQLQDTVVDHALEDSMCELVTDDGDVVDDADSDNCRRVQIQNSDAKQTRATTVEC